MNNNYIIPILLVAFIVSILVNLKLIEKNEAVLAIVQKNEAENNQAMQNLLAEAKSAGSQTSRNPIGFFNPKDNE